MTPRDVADGEQSLAELMAELERRIDILIKSQQQKGADREPEPGGG